MTDVEMYDVEQDAETRNSISQPRSHHYETGREGELSKTELQSVVGNGPKVEHQLSPLNVNEHQKLRPQQLPLPGKLRSYKPPPQHVIVIAFGSYGIRYGFASDPTPRKLFPAVAFPRHPQVLNSSELKPVRVPHQFLRTEEDINDALETFDAVCDEIVNHLALGERRRGGGKPIPWKVEVEPLEMDKWAAEDWLQNESIWSFDRGETIVGLDVLKLARDEERAAKYDIIFPIWDGKITFDCGASASLMRKAWEVILDYIVQELQHNRKDQKPKTRNEMAGSKDEAELLREHNSFLQENPDSATTFVSLIFPETSQRRDVSELVAAAFRAKSLKCGAVFVHQSAVSCALGAGLATCVVVDIGHSATAIACVEDGMVCGETRVHLQYGSYHVQKAFELLLKRNCPNFNQLVVADYEDKTPSKLAFLLDEEAWMVTKICEQTVGFNVDENDALHITQVKAPSGRTLRMKLGIGLRAVPAYGIIYPQLLKSAVDSQPVANDIVSRGVFERNSEDDNFVSDIFNDLRRSFIATSALPIALFANDKGQPAEYNVTAEAASLVDAIIWSVAKAIEVKRPDQQTRTPDHYRRYLNAILLAGGGASIEGIAPALEGRIKKGFQDAGLNISEVTVIDGGKGKGDEELAAAAAVLKDVESDGGLLDDTDTASLPWKGGAVMVEADAVNDFWVYRDDWDARNVRALREKAPFYW